MERPYFLPRRGQSATQVQALIDAETAGDVAALIAAAVAAEVTARNAAITAAVTDQGAPRYVQTYDAGAVNAAGAVTANRVYLAEVREWPLVLTQLTTLSWHVATPGTGHTAMAAVYSFDGATWTKLSATASTTLDAFSTDTADIALAAAVPRPAALRRYLAFIASSTTPTFARIAGLAPPNGRGSRSVYHDPGSYTLPATIAVGSVTESAITVWVGGV